MGLKALKKISEIKFESKLEKKLNDDLLEYKLKTLGGREKKRMSSKEIGVKFFYTKVDIKKGLSEGYVVCVDCFNRYFLYLCREVGEIHLLKIRFDLNEIFGGDIVGVMDVREEEIIGRLISISEADNLIENYINWIKEKDNLKLNRDDLKSGANIKDEVKVWLNDKG